MGQALAGNDAGEDKAHPSRSADGDRKCHPCGGVNIDQRHGKGDRLSALGASRLGETVEVVFAAGALYIAFAEPIDQGGAVVGRHSDGNHTGLPGCERLNGAWKECPCGAIATRGRDNAHIGAELSAQ